MKKNFNKIYIEITNVCNLNCGFCPKTKRKLEFMPFELFKRSVDESKPLCDEITLHIMGEPLLHPNIEDFIKYAESQDVRINISTNGTLIEKYSELLLNKSIRRINFSIHGLKSNFSQEEVNEYLLKIINFSKIAHEKREDLLIIYRLWNVGNESNQSVLDILDREFDVNLKEETEKISSRVGHNTFIHYDNSFEWPDSNKEVVRDRGYCHALTTHIGILADGTVVPCCLDNNGNIPLGNIVDDSLKNILNTTRAVNMKLGFKHKKLIEDMCKKCTFIKMFDHKL